MMWRHPLAKRTACSVCLSAFSIQRFWSFNIELHICSCSYATYEFVYLLYKRAFVERFSAKCGVKKQTNQRATWAPLTHLSALTGGFCRVIRPTEPATRIKWAMEPAWIVCYESVHNFTLLSTLNFAFCHLLITHPFTHFFFFIRWGSSHWPAEGRKESKRTRRQRNFGRVCLVVHFALQLCAWVSILLL